jgi:hypothetical protein
MVKALHKAGIEVILDVVFNHTSEGNHQGPVISFKGFEVPPQSGRHRVGGWRSGERLSGASRAKRGKCDARSGWQSG